MPTAYLQCFSYEYKGQVNSNVPRISVTKATAVCSKSGSDAPLGNLM